MTLPLINGLVLDLPPDSALTHFEQQLAILAPDWRASQVRRKGLWRWLLSPIQSVTRTVAEAFSRLHAIVRAVGESIHAGVRCVMENVSYPDPPIDPFWHLKAIQAIDVADTGQVKLGHIDTGYIDHPAFRDAFIGGADLIDHALPPWADDDGFLGEIFKFHGARTGAILGARAGARWRGIAPNSPLVPIRAVHSPILLTNGDYLRLAAAIDHACAAGVRVISISLGGLWPHPELERALLAARQQDVIVVAAAGQPMRRVTYPGRYATVVTAAATTFAGQPAAWSARGPEVDVAAPGQGIWTLDPEAGPEALKQSWGTSYATALTAGAAALWLQKYGNQVGGQSVAAFMGALRAADFEPVGSAGEFGAGQLDVSKLLATPPNTIASFAGMPVSWADTASAFKARLLARLPEFLSISPQALQDALRVQPARTYSPAEQDLILQELAFHDAFGDGVAAAVWHTHDALKHLQPNFLGADRVDRFDPLPDASPELKAYLMGYLGWG